jgi:crotonobetainyl-CoA:carnitine CoA-transferase CaiB-like acyl-CoA transferase
MSSALEGLKVLDLTIAMAGPLATSRLGDLGADVIKVESPSGDFSRQWPLNGYSHGGDSSAFLMLNRNKRSLVLDLKNPDARVVVDALAKWADVVVQNFRPGVADRLGVGYDRLRTINPQMVYVAISGYGDAGPMVERPGQDLLVQSMSGMTFNAGTADGLPHPSPVYLADAAASHLAAQAALAGYIARLRTGKGALYKVSLLGAALEIQIQEISTYLTSRRSAERSSRPFASTWMEPPYGIYRTADSFIAIAHAKLPVLAELFDEPRLLELDQDRPKPDDVPARARFRDDVGTIVAQQFARRTTQEWLDHLTPHDVWVGPVLTYAELERHPQARDLFIEVDHPAGPYKTLAATIKFEGAQPPRRAPQMGEHTREIIEQLGLSDQLLALRDAGAVR